MAPFREMFTAGFRLQVLVHVHYRLSERVWNRKLSGLGRGRSTGVDTHMHWKRRTLEEGGGGGGVSNLSR